MKEKTKKSYIFDITISTVLGMVITMLLVVVFSLVLNFFDVPAKCILPTNQVIKYLGVFLGVFFGITNKTAGLVKGCIAGIAIILLLFLMFSGLGGSIVFTKYTAIDLISGMLVGIFSGVLAVNLKKQRKV